MARVVCPEPGSQVTLQSSSCPDWADYAARIVVYGPHRIMTTAVPWINYCPRGYGECESGCAYPGRCRA